MAKRYVHQETDPSIVDVATFQARADEEPSAYLVGSQYSLDNGKLLLVIENDGVNVTAIDQTSGGGVDIFTTLTYDYSKTVDVLNIPETYIPVGDLVTPDRAAGTYVLGFSLTWDFDRTTESAFFRWRQNGGAWNEYTSEPTEKTDANTSFYEFPAEYIQTAHVIEVEMRKETVAGILNLRYLDIFFQRVG